MVVPRASIDIGSNSLVFLVIDREGSTIHDESVIVGLGKGLGDRGEFSHGPMEAARAAFVSFAQTASSMGVDPGSIHAIATSAARRAQNAAPFFAEIADLTGIQVRIIDGLEEARLTWKGALSNLPLSSPRVAVVDLGGGSTEVVTGDMSNDDQFDRQSLEMGTVRLMEAFGLHGQDRYPPTALSAMRDHIQDLLNPINWSNPETIVAVAGTATTIGAMQLGLRTWDRDAVHGSTLKRSHLEHWHSKLAGSNHAERVDWAAVSPKRADLLVAGTAVLSGVLQATGATSLTISDGGIRHGVLLDA